MTYGSVCSGIEAATVAWSSLGWKAAWFAETDPFCCALLNHHYPGTINHGDFTRTGASAGAIDVLVGGTPCQDFSVAGRREGISGANGNLVLEYVELAGRLRPKWVVWENVHGVLSSDGGRAFGEFVGRLVELGYCCAWRVLDAQYFGVPQRRRRVFVVGYLGDWHAAAAVLFERESLAGDSAKSGEERQDTTGTLSARTNGGGGLGTDFDCDVGLVAYGGGNTSGPVDVATTCLAKAGTGRLDFDSETFIAHTLRGDSFDAGEDGIGRGTPLVAVNVHENQQGEVRLTDVVNSLVGGGGGKPGQGYPCVALPILEAGARTGKSTDDARCGIGIGEAGDPMFTLQSGKQHAVAFSCKDHGADAGDVAPTLRAMPHSGSHANAGGQVAVASQMAVRRLTPRECERLMGLPDDYTLVPWRGKPAADGPRYKAIGNSMAVPVIRWIGERIQKVQNSL